MPGESMTEWWPIRAGTAPWRRIWSAGRAVLHQNIGHLTAAAPIYRDLLGQPDTPLRIQALAANNLGLIEAQHGRYAEAQRRLTEAARAAAEVGPAVAAMVAQSRAWTTVQSGRLAEALQLFDEAAKAYGAANLPLGEHYVEYVDALTDLRLIPEAMTVARRAVDEFGRGGIGLTRAEAQLQVARLAVPGRVAGPCRAGHRRGAAAVGYRHGRRPARRAPGLARAGGAGYLRDGGTGRAGRRPDRGPARPHPRGGRGVAARG